MCPMCVTTAVLIAGGLASTGGLAAVAIKKLGSRNIGGPAQRRWPTTSFWHSTNGTLSGSRGRESVTLTSAFTEPG
jgi:hypothetical protein